MSSRTLQGRSRSVRPDFETAIVTLLFTAIAAAACLMPAQSDTYWQLRAGSEIVSTGRILLTDTFTHTVAGAYWPNHEWLSEVVFFLMHRAGGMPLLTIFAAGAVTLAIALSWRLMVGPLRLRLAITLAVLIPSAQLWSLRPQVISLALLGTLVWLLARGRFLFVPVLFVIWANAHAGVTVGLAGLAGATAGLVWSGARHRYAALAICAVAILAAAATPLGWTLYTEVPAMLARLDAYNVQEWRAASLTEAVNVPFWIAAALLLAGAWRARRTLAPEDAVIVGAACALLPLALGATRNIPPFLLLAGPALSRLAPHTWRTSVERPHVSRPHLHLAMTLLPMAAAALLVMGTWRHPPGRMQWQPVPPAVVQGIEACGANLYNRYDTGGFVTWFAPGTPVFIDSRQDPFPAWLVTEHIRVEKTGDYRALFDRFDIGCALVAEPSVLKDRLVADRWSVRADAGGLAVLAAPGRTPDATISRAALSANLPARSMQRE